MKRPWKINLVFEVKGVVVSYKCQARSLTVEC